MSDYSTLDNRQTVLGNTLRTEQERRSFHGFAHEEANRGEHGEAAVGDFHVRVALSLRLVDVVEEPEHVDAFGERRDALNQTRVHGRGDVGVLLASPGDRGGDAGDLLLEERVRADVTLRGGGPREQGGDVEGGDGGHVGSWGGTEVRGEVMVT